MSDSSEQDKRESRERAADPTIGGGRPLEKSRPRSGIPRGIEVLVKKASVDPEFRELLLERRARAAEEIGLELSVAEVTMLDSVSRAQIEQIIENTSVPVEERRVFLGKIGAAMLAVIGIGLATSACAPGIWPGTFTGSRPDRPFRIAPEGIRPDVPHEPLRPPVEKKSVNTVRVEPKDEQLQVQVALKGIHALAVTVGYNCPFESGKVELALRGYQDTAGSLVTCDPTEIAASKGRGTVTLTANATKVTTNRILVGLLSTAKVCEPKSSTDFQNMPDLEPGEYRAGSCLLCKIVEYHKVWPA